MPVLPTRTVTFHLLMRLPNVVQVDYLLLYLSLFGYTHILAFCSKLLERRAFSANDKTVFPNLAILVLILYHFT